MNQNYPKYVIDTIREASGLEDIMCSDEEFQQLSPREAFKKMLEWEGIIGYAGTILGWIEDIFKVKLVSGGAEQSKEDFLQGLLNILVAQDLDMKTAFQMADVICDTTKSVQQQ